VRAIGPPDPTPTYNVNTATQWDTMSQLKEWGKHVYTQYIAPAGTAAATEGGAIFASKVGEKYFGPKPLVRKIRDRAEPPQGVDGYQILAPRSAQHAPINWIDGIRGLPWRNKDHYWTRYAADNIPRESNYPDGLVRDSFTYVSPFTNVSYVDDRALMDTPGEDLDYRTYGGIAPLYAWGVRESKVKFVAKGEPVTYRWGKTYFFKEVFDDWAAFHAYLPYDPTKHGPPSLGWPGVMNCVDPFGLDFASGGEPFIGIKHFVTQNKFCAHYEFSEDIGPERQQPLYPPEYALTKSYEKQKITYPSGALTERDVIPEDYPPPVSTGAIPPEVPAPDSDEIDAPDQVILTEELARKLHARFNGEEPMETEVPVLPSNPPAGDDPDAFYRIFQGVDMNAGYASYRKNGQDVKADGQGYPAYTAEEAIAEMLKTDNCQGFALDKSSSVAKYYFANNWNPGQLGVSNFPQYNNNFEYYSRWVVPSASYMRVGIVFNDYIPSIGDKMGFMSPGGFELNDRADTTEFNPFGALPANSESDTDRLYMHLAGQFGNVRRAKKWEDVQCCAFEIDTRDGTGYFTRYL
jgi:hypothetical protein